MGHGCPTDSIFVGLNYYFRAEGTMVPSRLITEYAYILALWQDGLNGLKRMIMYEFNVL